MQLTAGGRLVCPQCSVELVVVRPAEHEVELTCEGLALVDPGSDRPGLGHPEATGDGTLLGKRYADEESGLELLCSKAGPGSIAADGKVVPVRGSKPLPSSD